MSFCPKCGEELQQGAAFCMKCGTKAAPPKKERKPVNRKKLILTCVIVGAVLLLTAGGLLTFRLVQNNMLAAQLEAELARTRYKESITIGENSFSETWITFQNETEYTYENVLDNMSQPHKMEGEYHVEVGLDGEPVLYLGGSEYRLNVSYDGTIESIESVASSSEFSKTTMTTAGLDRWFENYKKEKKKEQDKEQAVNMVMSCQFWNFSYTFGELIPIVFKNYTVSCEASGTSSDVFRVTVSGEYYFNKVDLPTLTRTGSVTIEVTNGLEETSLRVISDDGIMDAMEIYGILTTYGGY